MSTRISAYLRRFSVLVLTATLVPISVFTVNIPAVHAAASHLKQGGLVASNYGALPMSFIANAGQVDPSIRFQVRGSGGTLSFASSSVTLSLPIESSKTAHSDVTSADSHLSPNTSIKVSAQLGIRLSFDDANPYTTLEGADQLPGVANFFIGNDPNRWVKNVPTYSDVVYHDLYPGVDLQYTGHTGLLKGTYTLAAQVDPSLIRWRYIGVNSISKDSSSGDLTIDAPDGVTLTEKVPVAWQIHDGTQTRIAVSYQINADGSAQFVPNTYDRTLPLIIDPGLVYSTYLGGTGADYGYGIAVDGNGNAYITGYTSSTDLPTTSGAFQTSFGSGATYDVFVSKLNAAGNALDYSTYLGGDGFTGSGNIPSGAIAIDSNGDAYITGDTRSTNFPTTLSAYQSTLGGSDDSFVTELNPSGNGLLYSTYLGGNGFDHGTGIALDGSGNAYITGITNGGFPTTSGAFQTASRGDIDAFVSKLNPSLSGAASLIYSTYLGGSNADYGQGIAVDGSGNAYVTGFTFSGNFPTTSSAYETTGGGDAFVTELNPSGSALIYSTYLGDGGDDRGYGIALDENGGVYVTGMAFGTFPTTVGAYQTSNSGATISVFVAKLNLSLIGSASLVYSTYLSNGSFDYGYGIAVDGNGDAYVTGMTLGGFPTTTGAVQTVYGGNNNMDAFVSKLNSTGSTLLYSTYLGGSESDVGHAIAVDSNGNGYVTGIVGTSDVYTPGSPSADFPITSGAFQTTYGGLGDAFIAKLDFIQLPTPTPSSTSTNTLAVTSSNTPTVTATSTATNTVTNSPTATATSIPTATATPTATSTPTPTPIPAKIDTIGVYRSGKFYLKLHNTTGFADITVGFTAGTKPYPIVGDWTGAGFDTVGIYDQSNGQFSLRNSNTPGLPDQQFVLGNPNDQPLSGRWRLSAATAGVGTFRPSNGLIYLKDALTTGYADHTMVLGVPSDIGLAGDWNGKGFDSPGVYRPSNSFFYLSNQVINGSVYGDYQAQFGVGGDAPIVGDWVAQGHDGIGLFRQSNGFTYLKNALTTGYADNSFTFGIAGDVPIAGHWQSVYPPIAPASVLVVRTPSPTRTPDGVSVPGDNQIGG